MIIYFESADDIEEVDETQELLTRVETFCAKIGLKINPGHTNNRDRFTQIKSSYG